MQKRMRYTGMKVRDFQMLAVRLPPNVIERLDVISGGAGARMYLTQLALTMAGGAIYEQQNQAMA